MLWVNKLIRDQLSDYGKRKRKEKKRKEKIKTIYMCVYIYTIVYMYVRSFKLKKLMAKKGEFPIILWLAITHIYQFMVYN